MTRPLPSNNFTDSNGDKWFCVETESEDYHAPTFDYWRNITTNKKVKRSRQQIIASKVIWNPTELYKPVE